jgi:hypothetical protein
VNFDVRKASQSYQKRSDWLWAGRQTGRISSPDATMDFHFFMSSRPALGSTQWVPEALFSRIKWPGRVADYSPTSAEIKKKYFYLVYTSPYIFMALCLIS